jgi:transposase
MNKSDRTDAEALAQLARTGWYRAVHIKSEASDHLRLLLGARARMIAIRQDIEAQARGELKTYGIRLGAVTQGRNRAGFRDQLRAAAAGDPILEAVAASLIAVHEVACGEAAAIDAELRTIVRDSELARRLMTVPGVGPIVALNFIATVDDVSRFAKATDVGAYLGLTPRRYQSGEIDYSGRISKRGDGAMRSLLYEAANVLITRVQRFSPLKRCGSPRARASRRPPSPRRARSPWSCCACGAMAPPSPGPRRRCRHDHIETPPSVRRERNAVPPGRRQDDLVLNVEAG